ncbi:MAG: hypothetical protein J0M12_16050 [Deltaproteobacteria bacterium]|nr:hypothetical protein [Deltaproteobacteria bacterium]
MRDPQAKDLVSTASEFLDANQLDATTGLPNDPRGTLRDVVELWETPRAVVKNRLEAAIRALAQAEYPTYEDKRRVTEELTSAMDRWGFVAIAPATGIPSRLRCRQPEDQPQGYFYFRAVSNSQPIDAPQEEVVKHSTSLPSFKLADSPTVRTA